VNAAPLSDDLRTLYQEIILDHGKNPRNAQLVADHTCKAQGNNPMCGDRVTVTAKVADGLMQDVGFDGKGCAISIASASMMTDALKGQSTATAQKLFDAVQELCTGKAKADDIKTRFGADLETAVERLASLSGVSQFPVRVKCATLPWHALMSCLNGKAQTTTE
jgi:nitrogen fixation NifU-like protein